MSDEKTRVAFDKLVGYVNKYMEGLDAFETGVLKVHEFLGTAAERVDEVLTSAQDAVFSVTDKLDEHREVVWEYLSQREQELFGNPVNLADADKPEKPTADMSREEKIAYLMDYYDLDDTAQQREAFRKSSDAALSSGVEIVKLRKALK